MPSREEITHRQELLELHRRNLHILLRQLAMHGEINAPLSIYNNIREERNHIHNIKTALRKWGMVIEDMPNDEEQSNTWTNNDQNKKRLASNDIPLHSPQIFDIFLCHNNEDKSIVKKINADLRKKGLNPWLDDEQLPLDLPWQRELEKQIETINAVAVFIGKNGLGPWQNMEVEAFLRQFVQRKCPIIPAILPDCEHTPKLPIFLEGMTWVDFRQDYCDGLQKLVVVTF